MTVATLADADTAHVEVSLVIAFVDLHGFAAHCARVDDREIADVLDGYYQLVADRITDGGGRLVKCMGDGVLAVFDAAGADRAVLALLAAVDDVDRYLRHRVWPCRATARAHLGAVVAGPFGPRGDRRFDVIGRAVNATAMLEATGVTLSAELFAALSPAAAARFAPHTPPPTYLRQGDVLRFRGR